MNSRLSLVDETYGSGLAGEKLSTTKPYNGSITQNGYLDFASRYDESSA